VVTGTVQDMGFVETPRWRLRVNHAGVSIRVETPGWRLRINNAGVHELVISQRRQTGVYGL